MSNALVVCSTEKNRAFLTQLLRDSSIASVSSVSNGGEARRQSAEADYDIIVVNAPLSDEFGHDLCCMLTEQTTSGVLLLVKAEMADDVAEKVEDFGVFVVSKPVGRQVFYQSVRLALASRRRIVGLQNENQKLQSKLEEIRMVNRAKLVLIDCLSMSEPQAHRYIEKQAMDLRTTRRAVAENILKTYG